MYFITIKRMLEVCFSAHPNIQYRALFWCLEMKLGVSGKKWGSRAFRWGMYSS